jgi:colicin import membrane protein
MLLNDKDMSKKTSQKKALILSSILHVLVLGLLICSFEFSSPLLVVSNNDTKIVNAVAIIDSPLIAPPTKTLEEKPAIKPEEVQPTPPPKPAEAAAEPAPKPPAPAPKPAVDENKIAIKQPEKKPKEIVKKDLSKDLLADLEDELAKQTKAKQKKLKNKFNQELKAQSEKALEKLMNEQKRASAGARSQNTQGIVDKYKALILQAIAQQWIVPSHVNKHLSCQLLIRLGPGGTVLDVAITKSSGDILLDRSARAAVFKASPLPVPHEKEAFEPFREFALKVKPENILDDNLVT